MFSHFVIIPLVFPLSLSGFFLSVCLSVLLSVFLSVFLSFFLAVCLLLFVLGGWSGSALSLGVGLVLFHFG